MIICVEGNIGAGKTCLLDTLESGGYTVVRQPRIWQTLVLFDDPAFLQCAVLAWYVLVGKTHAGTSVVFVERSPASAHHVFTPGCVFDAATASAYQRLLNEANRVLVPSAYFFLGTCPSECAERLRLRGCLPELALLDSRYWALAFSLAASGTWCVV
jgi:hypothetical protein